MALAQIPTWNNRIIGYGAESPDQLLANPRNWRIHPSAQQAALSGVLESVGVVQNVIVNSRSGHIVDGHLRVSLAIRANQPSIPVTYVDLSDEEESLILATLDPLAAMAATDKALLEELLRDVSTSEPAVMQMLSELAEEAGIIDFGADGLTDPDEVPEPPVDPITKPGDLWTLGRHRLLCGDSTNRADVDRLMGGEKADMGFTDPPYGVDYDGGHAVKGVRREKLRNDHDAGIYGEVFPLLVAASDPKAPFYIWYSDSKSSAVISAVISAGLDIRNTIIWNKNQAQFGALGAQYKTKHEPCLYAHRKGQSPFWYGPTNEVTVWDISRAASNDFHPTQKPVELAERAINNSSQSGDTVLDLFGGSGSTLIACEQTSRVCRMMELDPIYCDVIVNRWQNFTGETASREAVS